MQKTTVVLTSDGLINLSVENEGGGTIYTLSPEEAHGLGVELLRAAGTFLPADTEKPL